jgi:AraC-like DNA-binding protein
MAITQLAAQVIFEGFSRVGLDGATIARQAGLPPFAPPNVDERALEAVWREASLRTRRSCIPLEVGLRTPEASFGLIYYLAASAPTLGAGLTLLQRSLPLATPWLRLSIEEREDEVVLAFAHQPRFPGRDEIDLFILGILLRRLQQTPVRAVRPLRVELPLRAPADREAWSQLVDGTPLRFGARMVQMALRREDWALALRRSDPRLTELLKQQLALADGPNDAFLAALRTLLRDQLDRLPELPEVAAALGLSTRSLQRRLGAAGTTFERELGQVRRDVAEALLVQPHVSLGEVAARVGFAEQASFTRAFQRWTGSTPSRARRHLLLFGA